MTGAQLIEQVRAKIISTFAPPSLEIYDDSGLHAHHRAAKEHPHKRHLRLIMEAPQAWSTLSMLAQHRALYTLLQEEMQAHIHALAIEIKPPTSLSSPDLSSPEN